MTTETTTTTATTVTTTDAARGARRLRGLRTRFLLAYVGLLTLATLASVLVGREVLRAQLHDRIEQDLRQEVTELRRLARGIDPATARRFGPRVDRVFRVFLQRNVPAASEAFVTFVDGRPFLRSRAVVPYRLDRDTRLTARWGRLEAPERGRVETPAGTVEYLGVPLRAGGRTRGVFVVAQFSDRLEAQLRPALNAVGGVALAVLLFGSLLAWRLAEGVLRPVRSVTGTAREISETDLTKRIPVQGADEIASLAATFNAMLDRLEAAFGAQKRFLDDAAHELRTPVTIIRGHLELLGDDPQERRETVELVTDELDRMARLVNELLLIAKAERPDFLRLETVDVGDLTEELLAKARAMAPREWRPAGTGRGVMVADRQRVTQAIVQLADNAIRHTRNGDAIEIGSAVAGDEARFWVRDQGDGIPLDQQEAIFERFARGDGTRADGSGLGLAIVRAIAAAHGGRVELDSRPGQGATFTVIIPMDQP